MSTNLIFINIPPSRGSSYLNANLENIEDEKADKTNTKLNGGIQIYNGKYKIQEYQSGLMFTIGSHNFMFTATGSIWVDNTYVGGVK